ncbi:hypothetical protein BT96DRAFT_1045436 [Gymnopus androsaceus JB14]|uniref:UBC core domain-containing protein n=1 Tax=Gymnopus androsaceus JB14 TaxID=1447944 RepID=A0A6A4HAJ4_9AGAR|nr:hypothetical protein BT96DRAFT_1045436 [Gymnopus androsaceus JB14]
MSRSHKLLSRLYGDLAELRDVPYPGVSVFTNDADIRQLCLVLTPPSGPWKDLSLHFEVKIPDNWPTSPPQISSSVPGIQHPNLFEGLICCDLLKEYRSIHSEHGYDGGYSPALTLRGLFLQFLTFFSSTKVEQDGGYVLDIGDHTHRKFLLEKDVDSTLDCYNTAHLTLDDSPQAKMLEKEWNSAPGPEVELARHTTAVGVVVHKTKERTYAQRLHVLETESLRHKETKQLLSEIGWKCKACPYGSSELPYEVGEEVEMPDSSILLVSPPICALEALSDDCLYELAPHLATESVISLSNAYARFRNIVESSRELLRRELTCFFLRTSLRDSILGIGVALNPKTRFLSSDFEWLSEEAFTKHHVRISIRKTHFQYFLPLAFNQDHFRKAEPSIWRCLTEIDRALRQAEIASTRRTGHGTFKPVAAPSSPHETVRVIYRMMNNVVVFLMKSCDDVLSRSASRKGKLLRASEKAVYAYCHLFHLAICLSGTKPAILRDVETKVRNFIKNPSDRVKEKVSDIGELIVMITVLLALAPSKQLNITWEDMSGYVLEEVMVRSVRWVLNDAPELAVMEDGRSDYRLATTFACIKTSLRLIMFQIAFLDTFVSNYSANLSYLDSNYGFPDKEIPETMVEKIKEIYSINTWPAFFKAARSAKGEGFNPKAFSEILRRDVGTSLQRDYHTSRPVNQALIQKRAKLEKHWTQVQKKLDRIGVSQERN